MKVCMKLNSTVMKIMTETLFSKLRKIDKLENKSRRQ